MRSPLPNPASSRGLADDRGQATWAAAVKTGRAFDPAAGPSAALLDRFFAHCPCLAASARRLCFRASPLPCAKSPRSLGFLWRAC